MEVKPFIEAVKEYGHLVDANLAKQVRLLHGLYSQSFDMGMVVNPIEKPDYDDYFEEIDGQAKFRNALAIWGYSEDKVLFEKGTFKGMGTDEMVRMEVFHQTLDKFIYLYCYNPKNWNQRVIDKYFKIK